MQIQKFSLFFYPIKWALSPTYSESHTTLKIFALYKVIIIVTNINRNQLLSLFFTNSYFFIFQGLKSKHFKINQKFIHHTTHKTKQWI